MANGKKATESLNVKKENNQIKIKQNLFLILDRAHGNNTPGKCSPDGRHREWKWSEEICNRIEDALILKGYKVYRTIPRGEINEPGLDERVIRADAIPEKNKLMLSIHNNAAGAAGQWMSARGMGFYTTKGQTGSDVMCTRLYEKFENVFKNTEVVFRKDMSDGDPDNEANFRVMMGKTYFAILMEILFQDNKEDVLLLESEDFKQKVVNAIVEYFENENKIFN